MHVLLFGNMNIGIIVKWNSYMHIMGMRNGVTIFGNNKIDMTKYKTIDDIWRVLTRRKYSTWGGESKVLEVSVENDSARFGRFVREMVYHSISDEFRIDGLGDEIESVDIGLGFRSLHFNDTLSMPISITELSSVAFTNFVDEDVTRGISSTIIPFVERFSESQRDVVYHDSNQLEVIDDHSLHVEIFRSGPEMILRGDAYYIPYTNNFILHVYIGGSAGTSVNTHISTWAMMRANREEIDREQERKIITMQIIRKNMFDYVPSPNSYPISLFAISNERNTKELVLKFIKRQKRFIGLFPSADFINYYPEGRGIFRDGDIMITSTPGGVFRDRLYHPWDFLYAGVSILSIAD
jgi:hypothetical protein